MVFVKLTPNVILDLSRLGGVQEGTSCRELFLYPKDSKEDIIKVRFDRESRYKQVLRQLSYYFESGEILTSGWEFF